ncbi:hypothetical protein CO230_03290 [Chryseobacterium sp. 6424]|nr:hypothetical protein CO230_03290 [Chryseobacterium sp. 6424]
MCWWRERSERQKECLSPRFYIVTTLPVSTLRPGLNGALFAQRSAAKKREWKTETGAQSIGHIIK